MYLFITSCKVCAKKNKFIEALLNIKKWRLGSHFNSVHILVIKLSILAFVVVCFVVAFPVVPI